MSSVVQNMKIEQIRTDGGTQPRTELNEATVSEYGEAITEGAKFPPVTVFHDGAEYWLADGFHRLFAHKKIGALDIEVDIHQGTKRDAILHSVGANDKHGLRRSNEDKRKAVMTLLGDAEWKKWPQAKIAKHCAVTPEYVSRLKAKEGVSIDRSIDTIRTVERSGKAYEQNTANIGKKSAPVNRHQEKQPARTLESRPADIPPADHADDLAEARFAITELSEENDTLRDRLAVAVMDASDEEKQQAQDTITELRAQVKTLEAELDAVKSMRDTLMVENEQLKRQCVAQRRKLEKLKVAA